jgi:hypothetical protein
VQYLHGKQSLHFLFLRDYNEIKTFLGNMIMNPDVLARETVKMMQCIDKQHYNPEVHDRLMNDVMDMLRINLRGRLVLPKQLQVSMVHLMKTLSHIVNKEQEWKQMASHMVPKLAGNKGAGKIDNDKTRGKPRLPSKMRPVDDVQLQNVKKFIKEYQQSLSKQLAAFYANVVPRSHGKILVLDKGISNAQVLKDVGRRLNYLDLSLRALLSMLEGDLPADAQNATLFIAAVTMNEAAWQDMQHVSRGLVERGKELKRERSYALLFKIMRRIIELMYLHAIVRAAVLDESPDLSEGFVLDCFNELVALGIQMIRETADLTLLMGQSFLDALNEIEVEEMPELKGESAVLSLVVTACRQLLAEPDIVKKAAIMSKAVEDLSTMLTKLNDSPTLKKLDVVTQLKAIREVVNARSHH